MRPITKYSLPPMILPLLIAGCAQKPPPQPIFAYNKPTTPIRSIALITPYIAPNPGLLQGGMNNLMDTPASGGIIPAIIILGVVGGIETHRQNEFDRAVQSQNFAAQQTLITDLTKALTAKGYAVTVSNEPRPNAQYLTTYPAVQADAYLDVVVSNYGYAQQGYGPYTPWIGGQFKFVDAKTNNILMQGTLKYSGSASAYQFTNISAFKKNPQATVSGINDELSNASTSIATSLQ